MYINVRLYYVYKCKAKAKAWDPCFEKVIHVVFDIGCRWGTTGCFRKTFLHHTQSFVVSRLSVKLSPVHTSTQLFFSRLLIRHTFVVLCILVLKNKNRKVYFDPVCGTIQNN